MDANMVCLLMKHSPPGMEFKRDNGDFMNNFQAHIVALAFTNIEDVWQANREDLKAIQQKRLLDNLNYLKTDWDGALYSEIGQQFEKFDRRILSNDKGKAIDMKILQTFRQRKQK